MVLSPSVSPRCRICILFSSLVRAWRSSFFKCELRLIASTLNRCLAASHQCSGVGKSFFFVNHSCQKLFIIVLKTLSSSRLLLKCQNPSPHGCLLKSKERLIRSWSENAKGIMSVFVTEVVRVEEI